MTHTLNTIGKILSLDFKAAGNDMIIEDIIVDSRAIYRPSNTLFAALKTAVADGHNYVADAWRAGVKAFLVEHIPAGMDGCDATFIVVSSVEEALGTLAKRCVEDIEQGIVVTGSYGKTTVKEFIYRALLSQTSVRRSPRSWNSGIGLPLSLWETTSTPVPTWIITEAAIDAPGQATRIADILGCSHGIGVITPITDEHDSAFSSHFAKVDAKIDIVRGCNTIFYAVTDPVLAEKLACLEGKKLIAVHETSPGSILKDLAKAVVDYLGFDSHVIDDISPVNRRRQIEDGSYSNIIVRDYFTPDLRSLRDALDFFRRHSVPDKHSVLFLSGLLHAPMPDDELVALYEDAFKLAREYGVDDVVCTAAGLPSNMSQMGCEQALLAKYHAGELYRNSQILHFGLDKAFADAFETAGHDTTVTVDLDALVHNYNYFRHLLPPGTGMVAMVKASAYGLGAVEIGKTLQSLGASYLAVAVIEEALQLREAGITMPIMVLNPVTNRYSALFAHSIEPAVFSLDELDHLLAEAAAAGVNNVPIHLKLDTGMHRVGFIENDIPALVERLSSTDGVEVKSIFSHLATADCTDKDAYTLIQLEKFDVMARQIEEGLGVKVKHHILNTAGMMRFADRIDYSMARLGIGLYGISPVDGLDQDALKPVATFRSRIISLKHWPAGTPIGYGCRGVTSRDSVIATIPVGYADGLNRRLGNGNTTFYIKGVECPTIGNICMDLCMVDVTEVPDVAVGDSVEIFGTHIPVQRIADTLGTIPYEIFTSVAPRVKRIYTKS